MLQDFAPDALVIHHGATDVEARNRASFTPEYSHFRRPLRGPRASALKRFFVRWSDLAAHIARRAEPDALGYAQRPSTAPTVFAQTGTLPADTAATFHRNLRSIGTDAARRGARIILMTMPAEPAPVATRARALGIAQHNDLLRTLATDEGWQLVDAAAAKDGATQRAELLHAAW